MPLEVPLPRVRATKIGKLISNHEEPTAFTKPGVQTMMYLFATLWLDLSQHPT